MLDSIPRRKEEVISSRHNDNDNDNGNGNGTNHAHLVKAIVNRFNLLCSSKKGALT